MNNSSQNTHRWVSVLNATGEEIPPYGVVSLAVDDVTFNAADSDPKRRLVGKKYKLPVASEYLENSIPEKERVYLRNFAVNSQFAVPNERYGMMHVGWGDVAWVQYEELDAGLFGDDPNGIFPELGPHHDKFTVDTNGFGFVPVRKPDTDNNRVLCRLVPPQTPQLFLVSSDFHQVVGQNGVDRYSNTAPEYGPYARCRASPAHKTPDGTWRVDLNEYVVECTQLPGVVCPPVPDVTNTDDRVKLWCRWQGGKFWAIGGGGHFFPLAQTAQAIASVGRTLLDRDGAEPDYVVQVNVGCQDSLANDTDIFVNYDANRAAFWAVVACCPEEPA